MISPTALTLRRLRQEGYLATTVERWIPRIEKKVDLFHLGDVLGIHPSDKMVLMVQSTTAGHMADRLKRCRARPELRDWLRSGCLFEVHGWRKRDGRWVLTRVQVTPNTLEPIVLQAPRPRRARRGERQQFLFPTFGG